MQASCPLQPRTCRPCYSNLEHTLQRLELGPLTWVRCHSSPLLTSAPQAEAPELVCLPTFHSTLHLPSTHHFCLFPRRFSRFASISTTSADPRLLLLSWKCIFCRQLSLLSFSSQPSSPAFAPDQRSGTRPGESPVAIPGRFCLSHLLVANPDVISKYNALTPWRLDK